MTLEPLEAEREIRRAFDLVRKRLIDTRAYVRKIGYQGGNVETPVYWHPRESFWVCFNPVDYPSELLAQYGVLDPATCKHLHATVEINSPKSGINRMTAGAFVRSRDQVFLAHSGRVTITGRKAGTKVGFRDFCVGVDRGPVRWPKGKETEVILIGRIEDEEFPQRVAHFVSEVARFKEVAKNAKL
jgi:hypothetical protein